MNKLFRTIGLLTIGIFFFYFSNGKFSFALATWLFPVFILQVSRKEKKKFLI